MRAQARMDRFQEKNYSRIKIFLLNKNFKGFTKKDLFIMQFIKKGWGQDIAALSNMAEALTNIAISEQKSLDEIKEVLSSMSLSMGMDLPGWPPENIEELSKKYEDPFKV